MDEREGFMRMALEEARLAAEAGDIPVGAVIVKDGRVVGRGRNSTETDKDPTCHAEMKAIREAAKTLGGWRLFGCEMYVTLEPCSMCAGAIVLARIDRLFIGTMDPKAGACGSLRNIVSDERLNHRAEVSYGLLQEECGQLLKDFFRSLRAGKNKENPSEEITK
ncbi:MAG: tRNA adenosine(34) deaminase TadA [Firmicutes bacterium]|nr:tRNA adenosine(34) deaminase TadA [Bacillota bacterium]